MTSLREEMSLLPDFDCPGLGGVRGAPSGGRTEGSLLMGLEPSVLRSSLDLCVLHGLDNTDAHLGFKYSSPYLDSTSQLRLLWRSGSALPC